MDQIKENGFVVAVGAVGVVLLALAYFCVWDPLQRLSAEQATVTKQAKAVARYSGRKLTDSSKSSKTKKKKSGKKSADKQIPSEALVKALQSQVKQDKLDLSEGIDFYKDTCGRFRLFFGDAAEMNPGTFGPLNSDKKNELLQAYWDKFGIVPDEKDMKAPSLEGILDEGMNPAQNDLAMYQKRFWMFESIINAATQLELGGLKSITFKSTRKKGKGKRGVKKGEEAPIEFFKSETVKVNVTAHMRFHEIKKFIAALYQQDRVPYIDVPLINVQKMQPSLEAHAKLVRVVETGEGGDYDTLAPEPMVDVEIELSALDWVEVEQADPGTEGE